MKIHWAGMTESKPEIQPNPGESSQDPPVWVWHLLTKTDHLLFWATEIVGGCLLCSTITDTNLTEMLGEFFLWPSSTLIVFITGLDLENALFLASFDVCDSN